jgi:hypothetical protein
MQLATRVREEFYDDLKIYAAQYRLKLVEVLERGHEALKKLDYQKLGCQMNGILGARSFRAPI